MSRTGIPREEHIANRKARNKVKLDETKVYTYGWNVPDNPKIGDKILLNSAYGPRGLKGSLTWCDGYGKGLVLEIESKITRIFRASDLKDISDEYQQQTTTTPNTNSSNPVCGNNTISEPQRTTEEWTES